MDSNDNDKGRTNNGCRRFCLFSGLLALVLMVAHCACSHHEQNITPFMVTSKTSLTLQNTPSQKTVVMGAHQAIDLVNNKNDNQVLFPGTLIREDIQGETSAFVASVCKQSISQLLQDQPGNYQESFPIHLHVRVSSGGDSLDWSILSSDIQRFDDDDDDLTIFTNMKIEQFQDESTFTIMCAAAHDHCLLTQQQLPLLSLQRGLATSDSPKEYIEYPPRDAVFSREDGGRTGGGGSSGQTTRTGRDTGSGPTNPDREDDGIDNTVGGDGVRTRNGPRNLRTAQIKLSKSSEQQQQYNTFGRQPVSPNAWYMINDVCWNLRYQLFTVFSGGHLFLVASPVEPNENDDTIYHNNCPSISVDADFREDKSDPRKMVTFLVTKPPQVDRFVFSDHSVSLSDFVHAVNEAKVFNQEQESYNVLTNNCATFIVNVLDALDITITQDAINYVVDELLQNDRTREALAEQFDTTYVGALSRRVVGDRTMVEMIVRNHIHS